MASIKVKRRKRLIIHVNSVVSKLAADLDIDPLDKTYVLRRLQHEGLCFVTKTLPAFSAYALSCVRSERILNCVEYGLTAFAVKRGSPAFMAGLLLKAVNGCADALSRIRQFCDYFFKACFKFTSHDENKACNAYLETEQEYDREKIDWEFVEKVRRTIEHGFPNLVSLHPWHGLSIVRPHNGPGAFAQSGSRLRDASTRDPNRRSYTCQEFKKLPIGVGQSISKDLIPYAGYFRAYPSSREKLDFRDVEKVCELLFVPKDSRGPRSISKEPLEYLQAQMAVGKSVSQVLERDSNYRINFAQQSVNQELARVSSTTQENATLDFDKASDRVWRAVLRALARNIPILRFLFTIISDYVELPNGTRIPLKKFANMGSGVCFPILSLIVYATAVTLLTEMGYSFKKAMQSVYVYGDDLIIPTRVAGAVIPLFARIGLKVGERKSFYTGYFRESCGADYYHGIDVCPVRFRFSNAGFGTVQEYRNGSIPIESDAGLIQLNDHCKELVQKGLNKLSAYYYRLLEQRLGDLPYVALESNAIGKYDPSRIKFGGVTHAYFPYQQKSSKDTFCPYKGLGQSFASRDGIAQDWSCTPLRGRLTLKRRVPSYVELSCEGLPEHPGDIISLDNPRYYYPGLPERMFSLEN